MKRLLLLLLTCYVHTALAVTVTVKVGEGGNYFVPAMFTVNPGDTVKWVWVTGYHNTSGVSQPAGATDWYSDINSSSTEFTYVAGVSGLYTYTCTHHSGMDGRFFVSGCSYPAKPLITAIPGPAACAGDTLLLRIPPVPGATYQWINGSTAIPVGIADSLIVTLAGAYKVLVNACGVDSLSDPMTVVLHALPVPAFSHTASGLNFIFTNSTVGMSRMHFRWQFGDGSPDQYSTDATHSFPATGHYEVRLEATDTITGCSSTTLLSLDAGLHIADRAAMAYSISPNPAASLLNIFTTIPATVALRDLYGRDAAIFIPLGQDQYQADVHALAPGVYLLSVTTEQSCSIERVLITH